MRRKPVWAILLVGALAAAGLPGVAYAQRARVNVVEISPADAQIAVGQQQVFLASAFDRANTPIPTATFTFSSSNRNVATIDANGIAVGVAPGVAIITARTGTGATAKSAVSTLTIYVVPTGPDTTRGGLSCAEPRLGIRNANNLCYDTRPIPLAPPVLPAPQSCTGNVTPATVLLRVNASGEVEMASVQVPSNCAAFGEQVLAVARDLAFRPATKGGAPVSAWIMVLIRPSMR